MDDVLKVSNAARQTINPGEHEGVPRLEKVEQDLEFGSAAACACGSAFSARITSQPAAFNIQ